MPTLMACGRRFSSPPLAWLRPTLLKRCRRIQTRPLQAAMPRRAQPTYVWRRGAKLPRVNARPQAQPPDVHALAPNLRRALFVLGFAFFNKLAKIVDRDVTA